MQVKITKLNEVYMQVDCDASTAYELHDYFSFFVPGYKFNPKFKAGFWDGKIRLYHLGKRVLYIGLFGDLKKFCEDRGYELDFDKDFADEDVSYNSVLKFLNDLNLPIKPRDYQIKSFLKCIRKNRLTLLSPTASGKSLIIYLLLRWYDVKALIIVPTITLLNQMSDDFEEYGFEEEVHKISGGSEKYTSERVTISTWQSLMKQEKEFFDQFELIICDEAHGAKANELVKIMEKLTDCKYRFGLTGTLDDTKANPTIIKGLFGEIYKCVSTSELIEQGHIAELKIKCLVLKYDDVESKIVKGMTYQQEVDYICGHSKRNQYIARLADSLEGNTLILFNYVDKHGRVLEKIINEKIKDRPIFWISGATDADERNEIRKIVNKEKNSILLGSIKTTGTGVNIPNIDNIIFVSPSKAKIQTLQNIGRGLRKSATKEKMTLFDIADDFQYKKKVNYTLDHFRERIKIYNNEKFVYKLYTIGM